MDLEIFSSAEPAFDPARFDIALYHIGNNGYHDFVYETALRHPGVVVMHESQPASPDRRPHHQARRLGRLRARVRIQRRRRGAGLRRARAQARSRARITKASPMTRRLLESARGVIVHSHFMEDEMRAAGFTGPVARDPARRLDSAGRPQRLPPQLGSTKPRR